MTKETMIRNYRKFSAADAYIIGFVYKHDLYMVTLDEIYPRFMKVERESSKKGGREKLQLRLCNKYKEQLINRHGAEKIGDETMLISNYNKGVTFEKLVSEMNGIEYRGKDSVGFWVAGDIELNGVQYQIKLEGAQIVVSSTLENLKKSA